MATMPLPCAADTMLWVGVVIAEVHEGIALAQYYAQHQQDDMSLWCSDSVSADEALVVPNMAWHHCHDGDHFTAGTEGLSFG
jgi:hypothetical protein